MPITDLISNPTAPIVKTGQVWRINERRNGTHVIVAVLQPRSADSWAAAVIGGDDKTYPPGGYDIIVTLKDLTDRGELVDLTAALKWPVGFVDKLGEAVCALNLACEDNEDVVGVHSTLPSDFVTALAKLRDVAYPECPGCSEAGGADRGVRHFPPLCAVTPRTNGGSDVA